MAFPRIVKISTISGAELCRLYINPRRLLRVSQAVESERYRLYVDWHRRDLTCFAPRFVPPSDSTACRSCINLWQFALD